MPQTLARSTFETSRLLEFFSDKELAMQIGFASAQWPLALLKELLDNALDACETAGVWPDLAITLEPDALSIRDNGPGLPAATLVLQRGFEKWCNVARQPYMEGGQHDEPDRDRAQDGLGDPRY
jgi:DNA topoisomerase VI subunit B